jgi:hypothetical protein
MVELNSAACCISVKMTADNYSLVLIIFINFFGQLKDWVKQVLFLVSCPKGQVKNNVNELENKNSCYRLKVFSSAEIY